MRVFTSLVVSLVAVLSLGCPRREGDVDAGHAGTDAAHQQDACASLLCTGVDVGPVDAAFTECSGVRDMAEAGIAPLDIVWVIDNSGSMDEEAVLVQAHMNAFAAAIVHAGIPDYHVVVITRMGTLSVPAPLGTDPEHFLLVDEFVDSQEPLSDALDRLSSYRAFLRPDAALHFVFVTDDESRITDASFLMQMRGMLGHDFTAHAIASPPGSMASSLDACSGPYGIASANGIRYDALVRATGGVFASICDSDWDGVFARLTTAVAVPRPLPCTYRIPAPPMGEVFDRNLVNVLYTPDMQPQQTLPRASDCASGVGWRYDDAMNPTEIQLCPMTCSLVSAQGGRVEIQLGCETVLL